ncbi:unnamed protein product [Sympodiomycopsis kandeliae]
MTGTHVPLAPLPITAPKPFTIKFGQDDVEQFRRKLQDARLPDGPLWPGNQSEGKSGDVDPRVIPSFDALKGFVERWKKLDLEAFERRLNEYPHFTTSISWCKQLHFLHQPSSRPDAIPLILIHGWPGSFMEFVHIIQALTEPEDPELPAFHVVVPSLPGFTFSSGPPTPSNGTGDVNGYCHLFDSLMRGLGYERYAAQGGDWGSMHARTLASRFSHPDGTGCRACHLNFLPVLPNGKYIGGSMMSFCSESVILKLAYYTMSAKEYKALKKSLRYQYHGSTYYDVQRNRTSQLGYGLIDSPIALLGWLGYFTSELDPSTINEVLNNASAEDGTKIEQYTPRNYQQSALTADWLLEETFLYWITKSAATSFLPYAANRQFLEYILDPAYRINVPFGYSGFPREIIDCPYTWANKYGNVSNVTFYANSPIGGHLASSEVPFQFVSHLQSAFAPKGQGKFSNQEYIADKKGASTDELKNKVFLKEDLNIKGGLWDLERARDQLNVLKNSRKNDSARL